METNQEISNQNQVQVNAPNAVASLVLGILSLVVGCMGVGLILGIIGLVLSNNGTKALNANPSKYKGEGMLKAGKILSILGIVFAAISIAVIIITGGGMLAYFDIMGDLLDL